MINTTLHTITVLPSSSSISGYKQSKRSLASFTSCVKQYPFLHKNTKNELHKIHSFSLTSHLSLFLSSLRTALHNLHKSSRQYEKNTRVFESQKVHRTVFSLYCIKFGIINLAHMLLFHGK